MNKAPGSDTERLRYEGLDGLRAYSSIGILIMHVLANGMYCDPIITVSAIIRQFAKLVFLFMIISAFSMCCGYYDRILDSKIDIRSFYKNRFARIWPVFAVLCLLDMVISPSLESLYELFANLTLCFGLLPNNSITVIGVGWFLGIVFIFYMIFPFFCSLMADRRSAWGALICSMIFNVLCRIYFFDENHVVSDFVGKHNFLYCAVFFAAGGILYLYRKELAAFSQRFRWPLLAAGLLGSALVYMLDSSVIAMVIIFSLYVIYAMGNPGRILVNPVTGFLSRISLEIYLCHMVVFRALEKIGLTQLFGENLWSYAVASVLTLAGTVTFALVMNRAIAMIGRLVHEKANKQKL